MLATTTDPPVGTLRGLARPEAASTHAATPRPPYPWKTRIVLPAALAAAMLALVAYAAREVLVPAVDVQVVPVVVKATAGATTNTTSTGSSVSGSGTTVQAAGWVEADPYAIAIPALADGVVREVLVLEGQPVEAGQVVVRLVDDDAQLALARAEAELAQKQAELTAAQRQWDHPVERERAVAAGEAMVAETRAELARVDADVAAEAARVAELADELARTERSYRADAASEIEYAGAKLRLRTQEATHAATLARRPVLEAQLRQREADLAAAMENRRLRIEETQALAAARAAVALAAAARDEAKLRLERMEVRSPADGVVLARLVEPGSKLMIGMDDPYSAVPIRLFDPQHLQVRVDVPLADAAKVGVGMAADIVVGVLPDRTFRGVVTRVVQEADLSKNTLQVKVAIEDPAPELKPEMLARVRFAAGSASAGAPGGGSASGPSGSHTLFVPETLVQRSGDQAAVWVVDRATSSATLRPIELGGARQGNWVSAASGLAAGDLLVANPAGLSGGTKVHITGEADDVGAATTDRGGNDAVH